MAVDPIFPSEDIFSLFKKPSGECTGRSRSQNKDGNRKLHACNGDYIRNGEVRNARFCIFFRNMTHNVTGKLCTLLTSTLSTYSITMEG